MIPQIKQRIEQIRRGEVPEGYKKTKVGIVPADWQEHKLSHYLTVNNDKNTDLKYTKDDVFSISGELGIVNQIELLGRSYAGVSVAPYGIVYPNDVVYTKSPLKANPYGIIKTNKLGVTGIVSTLYAIFHCNNNVSPDYVQLYFESDHNLNNYLYPIVNIGAKHDMKISDEGSLRGTVVFPPLPEQEKIAEILQTQDKVIELQQKKIDELKRLKKGYLSKMFPKKGCNVPEIRFPGFTDAWEQRKFEEIAVRSSVICSDANLPRVEYEDIVSGAGRLNKDIYAKQSSKSGIAFHQGDVLYGKLRPYLQNWLLPTFDGLAVGDFWVLQPQNADSSFLYRLIQSRQFDEVANQSTGTKMPRADWKLVSKTVFSIPSYISEQAAIGTYFTALDNLITLHQRKCDEEKQKKKALMQLLLTGIVRT